MTRNVEYKNFQPDEQTRKIIDRLTSKLERNASSVSPEVLHLRVFVELIPVHTLYRSSIHLDVPGNQLVARQEQHDVKAGIRAAFTDIDRQLKKYKASLRGQHWQRPARREELRKMKVEAGSREENKRELFFSLITPHLNRLNHFVQHVISYAEAMGDLQPGDLTPQDVVDGALLRAYRQFLKETSIPNVEGWLVRLALDQLEAEVKRLRTERAGVVSIEQDVPETPPAEEVSTLGDEILDFYQPDEDLKLEDLIPDVEASTPENDVEAKELRRLIRNILMEMPQRWRRTLVEHDLQGRSTSDPRILQKAREYLRQRLISAGFRFGGGGQERAA